MAFAKRLIAYVNFVFHCDETQLGDGVQNGITQIIEIWHWDKSLNGTSGDWNTSWVVL